MKSLEGKQAQTIGLKDWGWPAVHGSTATPTARGFAALSGRYWSVVIIGVFLGMGYLWFHSRVVEAGWRIKGLEQRADQLHGRISALRIERSRLESPAFIKARLKEFNLDLNVPRPEQIIRVRNSLESGTKNQTLFSSNRTSGTVFLTVAP